MYRLQVQVYEESAPEGSSPQFRFLLLISKRATIQKMLREVDKRFSSVYHGQGKFEIVRVQDANLCDLDLEYRLQDVFDDKDVVRVTTSQKIIGDFARVLYSSERPRKRQKLEITGSQPEVPVSTPSAAPLEGPPGAAPKPVSASSNAAEPVSAPRKSLDTKSPAPQTTAPASTPSAASSDRSHAAPPVSAPQAKAAVGSSAPFEQAYPGFPPLPAKVVVPTFTSTAPSTRSTTRRYAIADNAAAQSSDVPKINGRSKQPISAVERALAQSRMARSTDDKEDEASPSTPKTPRQRRTRKEIVDQGQEQEQKPSEVSSVTSPAGTATSDDSSPNEEPEQPVRKRAARSKAAKAKGDVAKLSPAAEPEAEPEAEPVATSTPAHRPRRAAASARVPSPPPSIQEQSVPTEDTSQGPKQTPGHSTLDNLVAARLAQASQVKSPVPPHMAQQFEARLAEYKSQSNPPSEKGSDGSATKPEPATTAGASDSSPGTPPDGQYSESPNNARIPAAVQPASVASQQLAQSPKIPEPVKPLASTVASAAAAPMRKGRLAKQKGSIWQAASIELINEERKALRNAPRRTTRKRADRAGHDDEHDAAALDSAASGAVQPPKTSPKKATLLPSLDSLPSKPVQVHEEPIKSTKNNSAVRREAAAGDSEEDFSSDIRESDSSSSDSDDDEAPAPVRKSKGLRGLLGGL